MSGSYLSSSSSFDSRIDVIESNYVTTGSNTFVGNQTITGSVDITGSVTLNNLIYPTVDNGEKSFIQTDGNGVLSLQYVDTLIEPIRNGESTTLIKGTPVYISGSLGANPVVFAADAGNPTKMPVIYIVKENILTNEVGEGILLGRIEGVNTTGYAPGTEIFVGVGGGWTSTRPTGTAIIQSLGVVTKEGVGGQGIVLNPGPANLPNLPTNELFIGDVNSYPAPKTINEIGLAITGSNTFLGNQEIQGTVYVSNISNPFGFSTTSSLYTDGGLRVTKDAYISGSTFIAGNLTVYGTSSIEYVTSSTLIGLEFINLNTDTPSLRYAGINVFDSGSVGGSGSLLYDSQNNQWIFGHEESGSGDIDSSILLFGPLATNNFGSEPLLQPNRILKTQSTNNHGHHVTQSAIIDNGSLVSIDYSVNVTGSLNATSLTGSLDGSNIVNSSISNAKLTNSTISGKALGTNLDTLTIGTGLSGTSYNGSSAVTIANTGVTAFNTRTGGVSLQASDISGLAAGIVSGSSQVVGSSITTNTVTFNGTSVALGGSGTITAANPNALTIGTGLSGTSYSGASAVTIANTGVTSNVAGTGISLSGGTGAVTITNSGVTSIVAGTNISISGGTGAVTITNGVTNNNQLTNGAGYITGYTETDTLGTVTNRGSSTSQNITFSNGRKGLVGVYDAAQTQAVFAMGAAYVLTDGGASSNIGPLYGLAWSYNPDYGGAGNNPQSKAGLNHQLLHMQNGVTTTAIGSGIWTSGNIQALGDVTAYYSDMRLKTKISNIDNALDKVMKLNGFYYVNNDVAKEYGYTSNKVQIGVSAQEIEAVLPEIVTLAPFDTTGADPENPLSKSGEHYKTVKYDKIVPLFIEAIKEQQTLIYSQQSQIDELKTLVNQLLNK